MYPPDSHCKVPDPPEVTPISIGRGARTVIAGPDGSLVVYGVHNYGLTAQDLAPLGRLLDVDIHDALEAPLQHVLVAIGDLNFHDDGDGSDQQEEANTELVKALAEETRLRQRLQQEGVEREKGGRGSSSPSQRPGGRPVSYSH